MENEFQHEAIPKKAETEMKRLKKFLLLTALSVYLSARGVQAQSAGKTS